MGSLLLLALCLGITLRVVQLAAQSTSLLRPQVEGNVLRLLVESAKLLALSLADDSQNSGDVFTDNADIGEPGCSSASNLSNAVASKFGLELLQLLGQILLLLFPKLVCFYSPYRLAGRLR